MIGAAIPAAAAAQTVVNNKFKTSASIVIIGAGAAGTSLANRLVRRFEGAQISVIDPSAERWYQKAGSACLPGRQLR